MSHSTRSALRRHHRGLSLIELMVALTIGLFLMLAIMSTYIGSAGASRMAEAQSRMNEDAHAALTVLTQQLRMAGNNPERPNYVATPPANPVYSTSTFTIRGCDGNFGNIPSVLDISSLTCTSTGTLPDSIAISYEAEKFNTAASVSGAATDCLGQALPSTNAMVNVWDTTTSASVPTAVTYTVASNLFYIGTSAAITAPSLYCKGNGGTSAQPLVENIEDMQFSYGTGQAASGTGTLTVSGYLTASGIAADTTLATLASDAERWSKVMTVRICILVRSEGLVVSDAASAQYVGCDGAVNTSPPDLRLRRAYFTTVVLRNRLSL
jgi:type IV pilus assembly protein PilW